MGWYHRWIGLFRFRNAVLFGMNACWEFFHYVKMAESKMWSWRLEFCWVFEKLNGTQIEPART
jgi:hypothetical protein